MLIEKTKGNILSISVKILNKSAENSGMLIKAIADNYPKIESLFTYFVSKDLIYAKSLLLLNCSNLTYLNLISLNENNNNNTGNELLDILTKFSPKSLTNINLTVNRNYSIDVLERFLESYRGQKLLNFNIYYKRNTIKYVVNTLPKEQLNIQIYLNIIKEFVIIIKKKDPRIFALYSY